MAHVFCKTCRPTTRPTCSTCPKNKYYPDPKVESALTPREEVHYMGWKYIPHDTEEYW